MKVHHLEIVASDVDAVCAAHAAAQGAFIALPPLEIPGKGTIAIYIQGNVDHGLWQL